MHSYLRAIGFSEIRERKQLEPFYRLCLKNPHRKIVTTVGVNTSLIQFERDCVSSMGVSLLGEYNVSGNLSIEHFFPYIKGDVLMNYESISIEKHSDKESYAGVCEDYRLGFTLIFYVLNIADYAKSKWLNYSNRHISMVRLSALSISGSILLGVQKNRLQKKYEDTYRTLRDSMLYAARQGDTEAIENLTISEMDTYTSLSGRIRTEDIFSIVDTSFIPCGVECDHYMILGNILKVTSLINPYSNETVYNLLVEANGIQLNVGINSLDLQGEPKEGRRFRGEVWLQGYVRI